MEEIQVVRAEERSEAAADATSGMVREEALVDEDIWVGFVRTAPRRPSGWHHHGQHDTYFYVESGSIRMEFGPEGTEAIEAEPGDFVHVRKGVVHRELNPSSEEGGIVLVRVGSGPPVVNVDGPRPAASG